jgi:hypothetical protein
METGRSWLDSISRLGLVINDKSCLNPAHVPCRNGRAQRLSAPTGDLTATRGVVEAMFRCYNGTGVPRDLFR